MYTKTDAVRFVIEGHLSNAKALLKRKPCLKTANELKRAELALRRLSRVNGAYLFDRFPASQWIERLGG